MRSGKHTLARRAYEPYYGMLWSSSYVRLEYSQWGTDGTQQSFTFTTNEQCAAVLCYGRAARTGSSG